MVRTSFSRRLPSAPVSLKPAETMTQAPTPASPHSRTTSDTPGAGTAMIARSTLRGTWATVAKAWMPCTARSFGLTG